MGLNFDNTPPPATVDNIKKQIVEDELAQQKAESQRLANQLRESVRVSSERVKDNLTREIADNDRGWIDKYKHSDMFKQKKV